MKHGWLSRKLGMEPEDQWKKEIVAGAISYFAVVYIVMVNAKILSDAGMPLQAYHGRYIAYIHCRMFTYGFWG